jgi:hypothetical protein
MMGRMAGNFDLFIAHEIRPIGGYVLDVDALRSVSTRIVSAAGESAGEQAARRAAVGLAEHLGIAVVPAGQSRRLGIGSEGVRREAPRGPGGSVMSAPLPAGAL